MNNLLKFFHPNLLIEEIESKYNGTIQVRSEFGQPRIYVDGMPQTGGIVTSILKKAINHFQNPQNFLLLGIGGGEILKVMSQKFPDCRLTAVEIDPRMIKLAKKYFQIDQVKNLTIINQDAYSYLLETRDPPAHLPAKAKTCLKLETKYDSILVDCYIGRQIPPKLESLEFLQALNHVTVFSAIITFNRLSTIPINQFLNRLQSIFPSVITQKSYCNIIIIAKNQKS